MRFMIKTDGIIFDLDGTLWDSMENVTISWNEELKRLGYDKVLQHDELAALCGLPMTAFIDKFFPEADAAEKEKLLNCLLHAENDYIYEHGGILYEGVDEGLRALQKKVKLYIVSNCQSGYIEAFIHAHHMEGVFADIECWGNTGLMKSETIRMLAERNGLKIPVYVGDTQADADSTHQAGLPFIHAAYGFGEVSDAEAKIDAFAELPGLLEI